MSKTEKTSRGPKEPAISPKERRSIERVLRKHDDALRRLAKL
jgi:hypothetical protein